MDVLCSQVVLGMTQHFPHELALGREAVPLPAQPVAHIHGRIMPHRGAPYRFAP